VAPFGDVRRETWIPHLHIHQLKHSLGYRRVEAGPEPTASSRLGGLRNRSIVRCRPHLSCSSWGTEGAVPFPGQGKCHEVDGVPPGSALRAL
jgi:hypothetical protein